MNRSPGPEHIVYSILRLSVVASLIIIAIGIGGVFYQLHTQGPPSSGVFTFNGISFSNLIAMISKGDAVGILGFSAISLILGVVISIVATLITSLRIRDSGMAIVSAILLILLLISTSAGLLIRSKG